MVGSGVTFLKSSTNSTFNSALLVIAVVTAVLKRHRASLKSDVFQSQANPRITFDVAESLYTKLSPALSVPLACTATPEFFSQTAPLPPLNVSSVRSVTSGL